MKKLLLLLLALSFTAFLQAQSPNSTLPPEAVIASFSKTFPNVKNAIWEKHGKKYDVYFIADSVDHTATYKDTGAQILHRFPVALILLPKEVIAGVEREFSTTNIGSAEKIEEDGKIQYQLSLPSGESFVKVIMSETGVLVKTLSEG